MTDIVYKPNNTGVKTEFSVKKEIVDFTALLIRHGVQRTVSDRLWQTSHESILYQPPLGKVFFIVTAQVSCYSVGSTNNGRIGVMNVEPDADYQWIVRVRVPIDTVATASISPSIPLRVVHGQKIIMTNFVANSETDACVFGYELDEALLNDLI